MKKSIIIILAVVAILVIWAVSVYNGLVTMDENVTGQWANVETQYQRRADLIPNLVNTVKGYATHEKETLEGVVAARSQATQIKVDAEDLTPEKLAEYLAQEILLQYDAVRAVTLEVKKPWAPVHLPLETVSVTVKRQWHVAYLSIGSNMGDKKAHLDMAGKSLNKDPWTRVKKVSSYIVTEPVGGVEQDDFLNGAVMLETLRTPEELLELIGRIEQEQKRERIVHWGPRTVDLDIILYDQEIIQTKDLMIPHVEMANRMFVLEPMCEIAPYAKNPLNGCCMLELKEQLQRKEMDS